MVPCRGRVALFPAAQAELARQISTFEDLVKVIMLAPVIVCLNLQITNLHGSRVLDIMFIDVGVQASVEVFELREIPPPFLRDLMAIPPQVSFCAPRAIQRTFCCVVRTASSFNPSDSLRK